jgi:hypothetical protein
MFGLSVKKLGYDSPHQEAIVRFEKTCTLVYALGIRLRMDEQTGCSNQRERKMRMIEFEMKYSPEMQSLVCIRFYAIRVCFLLVGNSSRVVFHQTAPASAITVLLLQKYSSYV